MARVNLQLLDALGIGTVHLSIGGSLGGMVVLEMAALAPDRFRAIAPIAVSGAHSAWRIAHSSFIRKAIIAFDPSLQNRAKLADGLRLARQAAMISYRSSADSIRGSDAKSSAQPSKSKIISNIRAKKLPSGSRRIPI